MGNFIKIILFVLGKMGFILVGFIFGVIFFRNFILLKYPKNLGEINNGVNIVTFHVVNDRQIIGKIDSKLDSRIVFGDDIVFPDQNGYFSWGRTKNLNFLSKDFVKQNCAFIASKSGKNYYTGTSSMVGRINPENLLCFTDERQPKSLKLNKGK